MLIKSIFTIVLLTTALLSGCSTENNDKEVSETVQNSEVTYEEGIHFKKLESKLEGLESNVSTFFWFQCPHCNNFREPLSKWEKQNPEISSEKIHSLISKSWVNDYMLYESLKKREIFQESYNPLFEHLHSGKSEKMTIEDVLKEAGVDISDQTFNFTEAEKEEMAQNAKKTFGMEKEIGAQGVPYVVVEGEYLLLNGGFSSYNEMLDAAKWVIENAP